MPLTTYLCKNEVEILQNGDIHLAQIPDFEMGYLENHWHTEVSGGSFFAFFTFFHLSPSYFLPEFPFNCIYIYIDQSTM